MTNSGLKIAQSRAGAICIAAVTGRVDNSSAGQVQTEVGSLLAAGETAILLDLAGVTYLTSAAFRALLVVSNQAQRGGARLALCGVTGHVRDMFELAGLLESFTIFGSRDDALARLAS
jgi:anti-anti-sigma factor